MLPHKGVPTWGSGAPNAGRGPLNLSASKRSLVHAAAVPCLGRHRSGLPGSFQRRHVLRQPQHTSTSDIAAAQPDCSSAAVATPAACSQQQQQDDERRRSSSQCSTSYSNEGSCSPSRLMSPEHSSSSSSSSCTDWNITFRHSPVPAGASSAHQHTCRNIGALSHAAQPTGSQSIPPPQAPTGPAATTAAAASTVKPVSAAAAATAAAAAAAAPGWGYIGPVGLGPGLGAPRHWQRPGGAPRGVRELQQQSRGRLLVAGAAAAGLAGGTWQPAVGASMRCVLLGVVLTLGAQLLFVLLLRTLWARRALASLDSWLQRTFGVSLQRNSSSSSSDGLGRSSSNGASDPYGLAGDEEGELWQQNGRAVGGNGRPLSRTGSDAGSTGSNGSSSTSASDRAAMTAVQNAPGESVEWVNMCFRKIWRVYQRGLERWITDLLQPVFDGLIPPGGSPSWLLRLRIVELTLDHEAPYFSNMRRRNSRKDSDLTGVVDLRYTGGARLLLMLELGQGRWRFKIPVLVSDLDVQCALWLKLRLAPMCPWIGTISLAFVGPPAVKVQLSPYNRVRLMRIPVLQNLLNRLLTVDLPGLMVLPQRLEISIPPSVTSIAEAAVGRDTIMRAVASAVLQVDSLEQALLAALPLGPQAAAGGVSLPELFRGELTVLLREGRDLPVWGMPWQTNPWVRLVLGQQVVASRRDSETSTASRQGAPVWNQEVQFLVEDPEKQVLEVYVNDSHLTGRPKIGKATLSLKDLPRDGHKLTLSLPLEPVNAGQQPQGEVMLDVSFKGFEDDEQDSGYREAEEYARAMQQQEAITDIRSAAAASSRAAVAASAAISAIAMTKAAAARAAARTAQAAKDAGAAALSSVTQQQQQQQDQQQRLLLPPPAGAKAALPPPKQQQQGEQQQQQGSEGGDGAGRSAEQRQSAAAKAVADAVARQRKEREDALAEALEARMAVRVRSTSSSRSSNGRSTPDQKQRQQQQQREQQEQQEQRERDRQKAAAAAAGQGVGAADMTVTLPADILNDDSSEEDEAVAVARAQQAVVDILEKSRRMEAAVAELAALTAGSPAEAVLQEQTIKAAAATADALKTLKSLDATATASLASTDQPPAAAAAVAAAGGGGGSGRGYRQGVSEAAAAAATVTAAAAAAGGGGGGGGRWGAGSSRDAAVKSPSSLSSLSEGEAAAAAAAVDSALADYVHDQGVSSNGGSSNGSSVDHAGSNGSSSRRHSYGDFASEYSIWDEDQAVASSGQTAAAAAADAARAANGAAVAADAHGSSGDGSAAVATAAAADALGAVAAPEAPLQQGVKGEGLAKASDKQQKQKQGSSAEATAAAAAGGGGEGQSPGEPKPWWAVIIPFLPGGSKDSQDSQSSPSSSAEDSSSSSTEQQHPEAPTILVEAEPISQAQRHWWGPLIDNDFIRLLPVPGVSKDQKAKEKKKKQDKEAAAAAADGSSAQQQGGEGAAEGDQQQQSGESSGKSWWSSVTDLSWLPRFGGSSSDEEGAGGQGAAGDGAAAGDGSKPVEAIVIPADLPLEEIAREVAKLKEDAWRSKEDHLENLWARTVERNDRSWIMLLCFLLSVAIGLLAVVAYRIAGLGDGGEGVEAAGDAAASTAAAVAAAVASAVPDATAAAAAGGAAARGGVVGDGGEGITNVALQLPVMVMGLVYMWLTHGGGDDGQL